MTKQTRALVELAALGSIAAGVASVSPPAAAVLVGSLILAASLAGRRWPPNGKG